MFTWFLALLALFLSPVEPVAPVVEPVAFPVVYAPPVSTQTQVSHVYTQCPVLSQAGYQIWFPGQVAPYALYADTAARRMVYEAPAGYVVVYRSWKNSDGSVSTSSELRPLETYCH